MIFKSISIFFFLQYIFFNQFLSICPCPCPASFLDVALLSTLLGFLGINMGKYKILSYFILFLNVGFLVFFAHNIKKTHKKYKLILLLLMSMIFANSKTIMNIFSNNNHKCDNHQSSQCFSNKYFNKNNILTFLCFLGKLMTFFTILWHQSLKKTNITGNSCNNNRKCKHKDKCDGKDNSN